MVSPQQFSLPPATRIGWIGTGVMGASMCGHLLSQQFPVTLFTRSRHKAERLLELGAEWAQGPQAVVKNSDVIFTMIGFPHEVEAVYLGEAGLLDQARSNQVFVDLSTSIPSLAKKIATVAAEKQAYGMDAPVSGGDVGAREGTLSIMVGGDGLVFQAIRPFLAIMGKSIVYQGLAGMGQHAKLCNQIVIAGTIVGVCESLLYGYRAGLDLPTMLESIRGGAAGCWTLDHLAPRMLKRDFEPGFFVEHFVKDMGMALDEAKRVGLVLPGLALVHQLYTAAQAQGHGKAGTQVLLRALESLSHVEITNPDQKSPSSER